MSIAKDKRTINNNCLATVAIRVDASIRMGTGHVMRCLTLAKKLNVNGCHVIFLSKKHQGNLNQLIIQKGFNLLELSAPKQSIEAQIEESKWLGCSYQSDAEECQQLLKGLTIDLLIVDHYSLDWHWQNLIKTKLNQPQQIKIMVIDDLANRKHDCDILLDQTLGRHANDYKALVPVHCQLLLGTDFIMLRDEFIQNRQRAVDKRKHTTTIHNILMTMGGTDPDNIAEKLLIWLITFKKTSNKMHVTLVVSPVSPFMNRLKAISIVHDWISIASNPESMAQLMLTSEIAIGSSGATAWERCCLGLPSLSIISAENQNFLNKSLSKAGAIISLGHFADLTYASFEEALNEITNVSLNYQKMVTQSFACCDGLGATKVTNALLARLSKNVFLQKANDDDCQTLFDWQSNAEIRKYFHNPDPVKWQQHCEWLKSTLANNNKHLYIIKLICPSSLHVESVGTLRLDAIEGSKHNVEACWEISIIISPEYQGKKLAEKAIKEVPISFKQQGIIAEVHSNNTASHKLFSHAGFVPISPVSYLLKHDSLKSKAISGELNG